MSTPKFQQIIFPKMVKSYAINAVLEKGKKKGSSQKPLEEVKGFLEGIKECEEKKYASLRKKTDMSICIVYFYKK